MLFLGKGLSPPTSTSYITGTTGVHYHAQNVGWDRVSLTFCSGWPQTTILPILAFWVRKLEQRHGILRRGNNTLLCWHRLSVQRLSPKNKGVSPYIPLQAGYRGKRQGLTHMWLHVSLLATLPPELLASRFRFFKFSFSDMPSLSPLLLFRTQACLFLFWPSSLLQNCRHTPPHLAWVPLLLFCFSIFYLFFMPNCFG
jgi:hypothetical protein